MAESRMTFRWTYISAPLALLLLSVVITASFYHLLPGDVAYHFQGDTPDRWLARNAIIAWLLVPQFLCALLAVITVSITLLGARYWSAESTTMKKVMPVMGNLLALPQIILLFTMLSIFLYNAYQIKLIPIWSFALIVLVLGGIGLVIFFILVLRQFRHLYGKTLRRE
jgi:hypothetical protein